MKDTPTPETDAIAGEWLACDNVPASHARKLERERDLARATCEELVVDSDAIRLAETVVRLERERDEARQALSGRTVSCEQCNKAAADIAELNQRLIDRTQDMLVKIVELETANRALESQKEQWRMSSVCREKDAQIEAMREAIKEASEALSGCLKYMLRLPLSGSDAECETMDDAHRAMRKLKPFLP